LSTETGRELGKEEVLRHWGKICACIAMTVGGGVLIAWITHLLPYDGPLAFLATTKANACLAIALTGLALFLMIGQSRRRSQVLALCVVALGLLTLIEWHGQSDLGIDQLLCRDTSPVTTAAYTPRLGPGVPGRMGPNTSTCFILLGLALISLQYGRRWRLTGYALSSVTLVISLLSLVGNLYKVPRVFSIQSFTEMAPLTGVMLLLLSFGALCSYPQFGLMALMAGNSTGGLAARRFLPACILAPMFVGWLSLKGQEAGLYPAPFTVALIIVCMTILLSILMWWVSHSLEEEHQAHELAQERQLDADRAHIESQFKSDFLANMSHEIRTPMNGILGMTGILMDSGLNERQLGYATVVHDAGKALLSVINDILDFSKIEAGKLVIEVGDLDTVKVVEGVADILATQATDKKLALITYIDPKIPSNLKCDIGRVRQVLTNLAGNAIKFTDQGKVIIRAALESKDEKTATVKFSVSDTGIGMTADQIEELFQPFVQLHHSSRRTGGTGLGLSISKRLVQLLGGTIGVESTPGKGTTFWFILPMPIGELSEDTIPSVQQLNGLRVLLVCDQPAALETMQAYFTNWAAKHRAVTSSAEAIETLRKERDEIAGDRDKDSNADPGVAVIDLTAEGEYESGLHLVKIIRKDAKLKYLKLILITPLGQSETGEDALAMGADSFISRPVKQMQLVEGIAAALDGRKLPAMKVKHPSTKNKVIASPKRQEKILIVDDRKINQEVARLQLKSLGFASDVANDGTEALKLLETGDYAMILMDCQMPLMDGFQATIEIRKKEATSSDRKHIPIVAMTAHTVEGHRQQCMDAGMDDYLSKPVVLEQLDLVIEKWVPDIGNDANEEKPIVQARTKILSQSDIPSRSTTTRADLLEDNYGSASLDIVRLFLEGLPEQIERLKEAYQLRQMANVLSCAHEIKGAAGSVFANAMVQSCIAISSAGKTEDWAAVGRLIDQCEAVGEFEKDKLKYFLAHRSK